MSENRSSYQALLEKLTMFKCKKYTFVLWSEQFEELPATTFVIQLRKVGLRVKLVSLDRRRITGTNGLALLPDFTLEEILPLARKAIAIIIPCGSFGVKQLDNDPRLSDFFQQAHESGAQFIIGHIPNLAEMNLFPKSISDLTVYPDDEDLVEFARQLTKSLKQL